MEYFFAIRLFGLLIVSLYVYGKILDVKDVSHRKIIAAIIFSLIMSIPLSFLPPLLFELLFIGSVSVFVTIAARVRTSLLISSVVISVGISLGIYNFTHLFYMAVITPIENIYLNATGTDFFDAHRGAILMVVVQATLVIMLIAFINYLFKIKRLRKGILFWENKEAVRIGILFSILTMLNMSLRGIATFLVYDDNSLLFLQFLLMVIIGILTFGFYFWWRHHTTALYQQQLREDIIQEQQAEINEKDRLIKSISESNTFLSKTVHRDNKLIPAMYNAVKSSLTHAKDADIKTKNANILNELEEIIQERKDMISKIQREYKALSSTEIERIDVILKYMLSKATENNIEFDFVLAGIIKDVTESVITKQKLETLLADLIENAIIATSNSEYRRILVTMGIVDNCFELNIQDSGIPFTVETLNNLGLKRSTTHSDTGGSGIGYMTAFEILKESSASLTITEYIPESYNFTKSVKICFDGKSGYAINSYRAGEIKASTNREDMRISES